MKNGTIKVVACDDSTEFLERVKEVLGALFLQYDARCSMELFDNPLNLLQVDLKSIDILLLDIEMPVMDGFDVAKFIMQANHRTKIIFLTNHREVMEQAFEVRAYRFLSKPCPVVKLNDALQAAIKETLETERVLLHQLNGLEADYVCIDEIQHIEALGDETAVHTGIGEYVSSHKLKWWLEHYPSFFTQCHRSHLISLDWVAKFRADVIVLNSGREVPVAVRKRQAILYKLHSHIATKSKYRE